MNRRKFLEASALLSGGLLISFTIPETTKVLAGSKGSKPTAFKPNAFLIIKPDNSITVILSKVEMGQGIWTTLPLLLAEELDVDLHKIIVAHGGVDKELNHTTFGLQITGGSTSTWTEFERYRKAGATARTLLLQSAAKRAGVAVEKCKTENGFVTAGAHQYSYGDLAADAALLRVPADVMLRPKSEWKYIGKGAKRLDSAEKINGQARFGMDMQLPGMLTAVVAHAPVFGGKVKSFDATKARAFPGVQQVVAIPTGVAVLASNFWAAQQGRKLLNITWENPAAAKLCTDEQTFRYKKLAATNGLTAQEKGNVTTGLSQAKSIISSEYVFPYLSHAMMEPLNCTVQLGPDGCEIWTGTQMPGADADVAAKILNIKPEQVKVNVEFLGGGFGRRGTPGADFVAEAVHIAKASGKLVKMVWTREDDMKAGYYRPFFVHNVKVGLDANGLPVAWKHNLAGQSIMAGASSVFGPPQNPIDDASVEGVKGSPYLTEVPDHFVGLHNTTEAVPVLWFRSVGHTHTAFVMETMIDELAYAANQDPVAYRQPLLKNHPRHLAALNLVAEKGGWKKPLPKGRYRGIAVNEAFESYVATIAEISIVNGQLKVHKIDCAIDCGLAVNPDGVKAQCESGIIFGLTMALYGEITLKDGEVQQNNFYDYKIARMNESPEINVFIVESDGKMGGAGECAVPPTAPSIVNAVFAATGKRIYNLPLANYKLTEKA
jgi:isoquinoline 1-oxidoreductase beta subunit